MKKGGSDSIRSYCTVIPWRDSRKPRKPQVIKPVIRPTFVPLQQISRYKIQETCKWKLSLADGSPAGYLDNFKLTVHIGTHLSHVAVDVESAWFVLLLVTQRHNSVRKSLIQQVSQSVSQEVMKSSV